MHKSQLYGQRRVYKILSSDHGLVLDLLFGKFQSEERDRERQRLLIVMVSEVHLGQRISVIMRVMVLSAMLLSSATDALRCCALRLATATDLGVRVPAALLFLAPHCHSVVLSPTMPFCSSWPRTTVLMVFHDPLLGWCPAITCCQKSVALCVLPIARPKKPERVVRPRP